MPRLPGATPAAGSPKAESISQIPGLAPSPPPPHPAVAAPSDQPPGRSASMSDFRQTSRPVRATLKG